MASFGKFFPLHYFYFSSNKKGADTPSSPFLSTSIPLIPEKFRQIPICFFVSHIKWLDTTEAFDAYIDHDRVKVGFDLLDGYDEYDEIDDERDHTEYLIPRKELTYLLERWLAFIQKPITEPNYIEIVDSIEFGYCDSSGKLAPRCVAKDSSDNARRAIATYMSILNDIDIVRLVLDDLKNSELTWKYIGTEAFDAFIDHNRVKLGFDLIDKCDEIDDESEHTEYLIPRKKLTYLLERWLAFIQKPIPDPNYVEIIDSEDAYK